MRDAPALLRAVFAAAVAAADPRLVLRPALPPKPRGRCVVVGAGKSAALMAAVVDEAWPDVALSGTVVTRYGHVVPGPPPARGRITVLQAAHPVPDENSAIAARAMLDAVRGLGPEDLVLALISGGGSALLALPALGITLADKAAITRRLLHSGAGIAEMNAVRRHLSAIKGGRLADAAGPAPVVTLAISDVPGDNPATIASGPTWHGPLSRGHPLRGATLRGLDAPPDATASPDAPDAAAILARHGIALPPGFAPLPPVPDRPKDSIRLIATPSLSLAAAARAATAAGVTPLILGDAIEGEAREAGRVLAGIALSCLQHGHPAAPPCLLLSGGETTVTIGSTPPGKGGRNTEFLLAAALQLDGARVTALACDTDGIDGTEDAAGAIITPDTLARARAAGLDPAAMLAAHDSYSLFAAIGDLVITGPTLTNVNDFRAFFVG